MTVKWTVPADNGGSPITAYRVVLLQRDTEIDEKNVTDPVTKTCVFAGLRKSTIYSLRVSTRNFVFEGPFSQATVQTKPEGKRVVNQIQPVNRSFSFTWPATMKISWIKEFFYIRKALNPHKNFSAYHHGRCALFCPLFWPPWRHVKTIYIWHGLLNRIQNLKGN